ncbi:MULTISPECIES: cation transporter [unclassified Ruegeria]|uniref:cation transporter n=2 Tax=Ruegeria TaxID=97050 RepID=UPI00148987C1|nr:MULTISPECIES: cation transporter [unclassified Ruegeria]NOD37165.1 cation transporter [Ruegeria sp. HKCCD7296]NOE44345.1 cation transporter [Ruegeria sp. HKCCD7319]
MNSSMVEGRHELEIRAMNVGMVGNLFMAAAGIVAAYYSHSQAILVDGLFSLIGFTSAVFGKRVARNAQKKPDKFRPYGYAGDEALFTTFRSLSLLGLVVFAISNAALSIAGYLNGEAQTELVFAPMVGYFVVVGLTCLLLWGFHTRSWLKTGKQSDVLRLEKKAAAFDGIITFAAAVGLLGIHFFKDGFLAPIVPVGDSIIVLVLCATVIVQYFRDFMSGVQELAGATAAPQHIAAARRAVRDTLRSDGGTLIDLSVSKLGRGYTIMVYYDPQLPCLAARIDQLTLQLQTELSAIFESLDVIVVVSQQGRVLEPA